MSTQMMSVDFYGDTLVAAVRNDGVIRVGFRRLCRVMDLEYEQQLAKLKSRSWANVELVDMVVETGHLRKVTAIDLKTLHGWLLTIDENRVKPSLKPKLIQ